MTRERIGLIAASVLVACGLAGGFALVGTPGHQRDLEMDRRRAADIAEIAGAVQRRFHPDDTHAAPLPAALPRDLATEYTNRPIGTKDPIDGRAYRYTRTSPTQYRICATFALSSSDDSATYHRPWPHPAGDVCFRFDVTRRPEPVAG